MSKTTYRSQMEMAVEVLENAIKSIGQTTLERKCRLRHYDAKTIFTKLKKAGLLQIEEQKIKTSIHHSGIRLALTENPKKYRRIFLRTTTNGIVFIQDFRRLQAIWNGQNLNTLLESV